ncbi:glutathione S-transferase-like protein [Athelia psychrophila]|uniref:glutathione transferase n=1 Tax=Athelia psychrophila TaxID=1759441 RepID=A0A166GAC0_9AGAM|nr:glutathione S-transferase-like protein [Fibularhizoctonia sp. CBS 109695]
MVLTLYGVPMSTCVKRVAVVLKEKEIPFTFVQIDMRKGEHKTAEYLEKQPFGQVPYINDDGFVLYESRAIGRYLAAKYPSKGPALLPTEPAANALFEQAASVEQSNFDPSASGIVAEKIFKKFFHGLDADEAKVAELIKTLGGKLDAYETILSKQKYVAGNEITLADLFHLPYASMVQGVNPEVFSSRPHVSKWLEGLQARPSWVAVKDGVQ